MSNSKCAIAVLGGGSFGTAIANIAAEYGSYTHLWMRSEATVAEISATRVNKRYLPDLILNENLIPTTDLQIAIKDAELIFFAIPSKSFRSVVKNAAPLITSNQKVISTTKGIEPETLNLMSDILRKELPDCAYGVIGGPNLAKEIARHELTATVIASDDPHLRQQVQDTLGCAYFRVYASDDVCGVELGGTLKIFTLSWRELLLLRSLGKIQLPCY